MGRQTRSRIVTSHQTRGRIAMGRQTRSRIVMDHRIVIVAQFNVKLNCLVVMMLKLNLRLIFVVIWTEN
jgi:hypothetical protein